MRAIRQETITVSQPADAVFQAALGVVQNNKIAKILAVHNEGRKIVLREQSKMSNRKFHHIWVEDQGGSAQLYVVVGTDPRTPKAIMDGKANAKSLKKFVESVQAVLNGSASAPVTPVANHYMQKKTEVPWSDPDKDPEIELDGNLVALYGF